MDPRFLMDPQTGLPAVPMAGGGALPVGLSPDQFRAALGTQPAPGGFDPATGVFAPAPRAAPPPMAPDQFRQALTPQAPPPAPGSHATPQHAAADAEMPHAAPGMQPDAGFNAPPHGYVVDKPPGALEGEGGAVDPATLARRGGGAPGQAEQGGGMFGNPLLDKVFTEGPAGGGGGPRRLGQTGETQKYSRPEFAMDPTLHARSEEALGASDKYNEELAKSLTTRQEQAYQAQQDEYAARSGQMAAQQQRFEAQQNALQDYQAKRDAIVAEAAQLKAPQMEEYWGSRSTGAKMATGLSIALGGALQGLRGGSNPGLEMSNQEIEHWLTSKREDYQRAQGRVTDADNQYARMVQTFGSENLATEHLREQAWTVRDGMLKSYAEQIGTPNALEAYNQAMLQSEAQRADLRARASQGAMVEIEKKLSMQGGGGAGGSRDLLSRLERTARAKKAFDEATGAAGAGKGNPAEIATLNEAEAGMAPLKSMLHAYQGAEEIPGVGPRNVLSRAGRGALDFVGGEGTGTRVADSEEEQTNLQIVNRARLAYKHAVTGSGGSDAEAAQIDQAFAGAKTRAGLENAVRIAEQTIATHRRLIAGGASSAQPAAVAPSEEAYR